MIWKHI